MLEININNNLKNGIFSLKILRKYIHIKSLLKTITTINHTSQIKYSSVLTIIIKTMYILVILLNRH